MDLTAEAVVELLEHARRNNHRQLLVFAGRQAWGLAQAEAIRAWVRPQCDLWITAEAPNGSKRLNGRELHRYLGSETDMLVIDARLGFNPNAFGQITGTLRGGGLLLLLCPELDQWPNFIDPEHASLVVEPYGMEAVGRRFISRFVRLLRDADGVQVITEQEAQETALQVEPDSGQPASAQAQPPAPFATPEQQQAVETIVRNLSRGRRPVVMTADRGRGKSAALGIAAAQMIEKGNHTIWITAPSISNVEEVFVRAARQLPDADLENGLIKHGQSSMRYLTPDEASRCDGTGVVLLVDEAAAIPAPVLTRMLENYPRIVFSSTIHGYEGTGQGFAVRFRRELDRRAPHWKEVKLHQPIRWGDDDPLERLVFDALLLNADAISQEKALEVEQHPIEVTLLDRDTLVADEALLCQLFGLLVLAHYRTTPGDLRIMLDSPNLLLWVARCDGCVVGTALVAEEGPLSKELAREVWAGRRRPNGHLLPQTVIGQEGYLEASQLRCGRIMRIAVHPALQRRGIARQLIRTISDYGMQHQWDYLGSSFGATEDLLLFWQNSGFGTIRLGETRDAVSGTHAALVCRSLSYSGRLMFNHLRDRFTQQLPLLLGYNLRDLEVEVLPMLLQGMRFDTELSTHDSRDLEAFVSHNRSYESCIVPIRKLVIRSLKNSAVWHALSPDELSLLVAKALQQRSWEEIDPGSGRRALMRRMRALVGECLRLS